MLSKKNHNLFCNNCINCWPFKFNNLHSNIDIQLFKKENTNSTKLTFAAILIQIYYLRICKLRKWSFNIQNAQFASLLLFSWCCFHSKSFIVYTWRQAITQFFVYRLHISNLNSNTTYFPIDLFFSEIISFSLTAIFTCLCRLATTFAYILLSEFSSKFYSFFSLTFLIPPSFCSSYSYIKASFSMICLYIYCIYIYIYIYIYICIPEW